MRRDGRSSGAGFPANRSGKHISHDRRNNRQRVSVPRPKRWAESLRRERFHRSSAGRGQKGREASPLDRSWKRWNRRQELRRVWCAATGVRPARGFPQTGAGNTSLATDRITVSGFPFPDRSNGRNRSGGNESAGAQRGAAKGRAAFPVDRSWKRRNWRQELGAFDAPRRAFVQRGVSPLVGSSACSLNSRRINR
ncbi:MAG: hypothetical protein IPN19_04105 [Elusimicrobia bacterium]|nr:hypothetical protein [Elusimicrobiota bacterium]